MLGPGHPLCSLSRIRQVVRLYLQGGAYPFLLVPPRNQRASELPKATSWLSYPHSMTVTHAPSRQQALSPVRRQTGHRRSRRCQRPGP